MPQWAGSSWYFLRYCVPQNDKAFAAREKLDYWRPFDWYNGGMEHATLHLLYSRFWSKFLYDEGLISSPEPYLKPSRFRRFRRAEEAAGRQSAGKRSRPKTEGRSNRTGLLQAAVV